MQSRLPLEALDLKMEINDSLLRAIESDLGINVRVAKGQLVKVKNCWHFSTDGNLVDFLFQDDVDFIAGTNRIFILLKKYHIVIIAYCLMDTHVHFILWGTLEECKAFMHEYLRLTSSYISRKYHDSHKLENVFPNYQEIGDDNYLKTAICYVIKNPPVGGIPFNALEYPWSSGPLYFKRKGYWSSCGWDSILVDSSTMAYHKLREILQTRTVPQGSFKLVGDMVFPGEIVPADIVERIYRTHRSFNYFLCRSKESDVESMGGIVSRLSIPNVELHQHKLELCKSHYGVETIRSLSTSQRLALAKTLRSKYDCSPKQIAKVCGLVYSEVKDIL